jgi:hypothetical protein
VPLASLRATDQVQRDIEHYFERNGWFYDRRKNYYRNLGKPADKIISIPYLAQAMMAIALQAPDSARARPSSLIKDEDDYKRVFSPNLELGVYLWAAKTQRAADVFLRSDRAAATPEERSNLRFHLATAVVLANLGKRLDNPADLHALTGTEFSEDDFAAALDLLRETLTKYQAGDEQPLDRIAKGSDFVRYFLDECFPREAATAEAATPSDGTGP